MPRSPCSTRPRTRRSRITTRVVANHRASSSSARRACAPRLALPARGEPEPRSSAANRARAGVVQLRLRRLELAALDLAAGDRAIRRPDVGAPGIRRRVERRLCVGERRADGTLLVQRPGPAVARRRVAGGRVPFASGVEAGVADLEISFELVREQHRSGQERPAEPVGRRRFEQLAVSPRQLGQEDDHGAGVTPVLRRAAMRGPGVDAVRAALPPW